MNLSPHRTFAEMIAIGFEREVNTSLSIRNILHIRVSKMDIPSQTSAGMVSNVQNEARLVNRQ